MDRPTFTCPVDSGKPRRGTAVFPSVPYLLPLCLFLLLTAVLGAQFEEYDVKANIVGRFLEFVIWPADIREGPLRMAVLGGGKLSQTVQRFAREWVIKGRSVEVVQVDSLDEVDESFHVLLIPAQAGKDLGVLPERLVDHPVLTVGEYPEALSRGVQINFYIDQERVRFEIHPGAVLRSGLIFSADLYRLARIVEKP